MNHNPPDEYSVGPLDNSTWLVLLEMCHVAGWNAETERQEEEYREAREAFLAAHPDEATGSPEDWPESMRQAWDETVSEWFDEESRLE